MSSLKRSEKLFFRVRPHEREAIERAAELSRQYLSEFIRTVLIDAAQRRIARAEQETDR